MNKYLTQQELKVFNRWGVPVRYIRDPQRTRIFERDRYRCKRCGNTNLKELTVAHIIPYTDGARKGGYTPDWLNRDENLVIACRKSCNNLMQRKPWLE